MEYRTVYLYTLTDPFSGEVCYIGQTLYPEIRRLAQLKYDRRQVGKKKTMMVAGLALEEDWVTRVESGVGVAF